MPAMIGHSIETDEPIAIGDRERQAGLYVLGKPEIGKTALLAQLITQDIENGRGMCVLDPHGNLISECLRLNKSREEYINVVEPGSTQELFPINPFFRRDFNDPLRQQEIYRNVREVFRKTFEDKWESGSWMERISEKVLEPIIGYNFGIIGAGDLVDVWRFFAEPDFRDYVLSRNIGSTKYEEAVDFWNDAFQSKEGKAAITRIEELLSDRYVKHIIGHPITIDFEQDMEEEQVTFVNLSTNLADDRKKFIGALIVSELVRAIRKRSENERRLFSIFVDDFHNLLSVEDLETLITQAHRFSIATTIAHEERFQHLDFNMFLKMFFAAKTISNKVAFQLTQAGANHLGREFACAGGEFDHPTKRRAEVIQDMVREMVNLPPYTACAKIMHEENGRQEFIVRKVRTLPLVESPQIDQQPTISE